MASGLTYQSLWRDEVDSVRFANRSLADLLLMAVTPGQNGGLYFAVLRGWMGLVGQSEFALRFFSVIPGVLSVPVAYRLARRLYPSAPRVALTASALLATSPYLVWYGQEGKMYAAVVLAAVLSMERFLAAVRHGGVARWLAYAVVTGAACYVHLAAILLIPAQVGAFLLCKGWRRPGHWKPWFAALLLLLLLCLPLLRWELPMMLESAETGYAFVPLSRMVASLVGSFGQGVVQKASWWALVPHALLLGTGLFFATSGTRSEAPSLLVSWLVIPVVCLYLVTLSRPVYTARYLILVLPAFVFLIASGVGALGRHSRWLAAGALLGLVAVSGYGLWAQASTPLKADFRSATRFLERRLDRNDLIIFQIPHGRLSFEYYLGLEQEQASLPSLEMAHRVFLPVILGGGSQYRWADGLYTNNGMGMEEVDQRMRRIVSGTRSVWLVASEMGMWDDRRLVQAWLEENASAFEVTEFVRVAVHRYVMP